MTESTTPETITVDGKDLTVEEVDGKRMAKDANNNTYVLSDGPKAQKKPTAIDIKRMRIYQERIQRLVGKGMTEENARLAIQEEDYRALPLDKKFDLLVQSVRAAVTGFAGDINELRHNDQVVSDVIDVNARAFSKIFVKLGVSLEDQSVFIKEADVEVRAELKKRMDDAMENQQRLAKQRADLTEAKIAEALKNVEDKHAVQEQPPTDPNPIPEGATTFGG